MRAFTAMMVSGAILLAMPSAVWGQTSPWEPKPVPPTNPTNPSKPRTPPGDPEPLPGQLPTSPLNPPKKPGGKTSAEQLVQVRMLADAAQIRPGQSFHLAFVFDIEPSWHTYWQNAGEGGMATTINVKAPLGFVVGETRFPRPKAFKDIVGTSFGYEKQTVLFVEITAPIELMPQMAIFHAEATFLVCKDVCLLGRAKSSLSLPTLNLSPQPPKNPELADPIVQQYKARLPKPLHELSGSSVKYQDGKLTVEVPAQGRRAAEFFPIETPGITFGQPSIEVKNDTIIITADVEANPNNAQGENLMIKGLIGLGQEQSEPAYEFETPAAAK